MSEKEGLSEAVEAFEKKTKFEGHTLRRCHESKAEREINPGSSNSVRFCINFFSVSTENFKSKSLILSCLPGVASKTLSEELFRSSFGEGGVFMKNDNFSMRSQ